jgi:hypothetical protein
MLESVSRRYGGGRRRRKGSSTVVLCRTRRTKVISDKDTARSRPLSTPGSIGDRGYARRHYVRRKTSLEWRGYHGGARTACMSASKAHTAFPVDICTKWTNDEEDTERKVSEATLRDLPESTGISNVTVTAVPEVRARQRPERTLRSRSPDLRRTEFLATVEGDQSRHTVDVVAEFRKENFQLGRGHGFPLGRREPPYATPGRGQWPPLAPEGIAASRRRVERTSLCADATQEQRLTVACAPHCGVPAGCHDVLFVVAAAVPFVHRPDYHRNFVNNIVEQCRQEEQRRSCSSVGRSLQAHHEGLIVLVCQSIFLPRRGRSSERLHSETLPLSFSPY